MAFEVQDATAPTETANAYASVDDFKAYHGDRGTDVSAYTDADIEAKLVQAADYIDARYTYDGDQLDGTQSTQFPRVNASFEGIPRGVVRASCEYALKLLAGGQLFADAPASGGRVVSEESVKVGPLEESKKYAVGVTSGPGSTYGVFPLADAYLKAYVRTSAQRVIRA